MTTYILIVLTALVIAIAATPLARLIATRLGIMDVPNESSLATSLMSIKWWVFY